MTGSRPKPASRNRKGSQDTLSFEDRLLVSLKPKALQISRYAAIWSIRMLAILWIPVKLVLKLIWNLIAGFIVGLLREIRVTRDEGRKIVNHKRELQLLREPSSDCKRCTCENSER